MIFIHNFTLKRFLYAKLTNKDYKKGDDYMGFKAYFFDNQESALFFEDEKGIKLVVKFKFEEEDIVLEYGEGYDQLGIYHDFAREKIFNTLYEFGKKNKKPISSK